MGISQDDQKMEGWLYLIRSSRLGLQFSTKRYFVLEGNSLNCYRYAPTSRTEDPTRSAMINSYIRVTDNGRESIHRNVFFIFTLYNASNHNDQLKLGARSSEEAARWIRSLTEAALKESPLKGGNVMSHSKKGWLPFSVNRSKRGNRLHSVDWAVFASLNVDLMTSDVIAPSPWTIFGCTNGLRLFKETKDGERHGKSWDDHPAIMAVGVVDATPEAIFQTVMCLGPLRSEWDFCFVQGRVVEHLDGHTDIIHERMRSDWLPWGMKKRDLLLQRYWRREDDGTYVILFHSAFNQNCQPMRGYIRACLKSGGYVISPVNQGEQSVVKHMLAIDWRFWKAYLFTSSGTSVTIRMLERVAALRELFRVKLRYTPELEFTQTEKDIEEEVESPGDNHKSEESTEGSQRSAAKRAGGSIHELNDAADEFFDSVDQSEYNQPEATWPSDEDLQSQDHCQPKLSTAAVLVKRLHDFAVQKRGYMDLQEASMGDPMSFSFGATLQRDSSCTAASSWSTADPSTFLIRSKTYLQDRQKIKANGMLMQMVAADWIKSDKREDDLGGRPGSIVQKFAELGGKEFFFIMNIQVPGSSTYSLAFYYMMDTPVEDVPLLERFVKGDDAFRNSRFKLIPHISKGPWLVKQSVGKKACLVGQALKMNYFHGRNYLELGIDVGSSTVARGVTSLVLGYLSNLVVELAFLIQGNTEEELPEFLLGTVRLNHVDPSKAASINSW